MNLGILLLIVLLIMLVASMPTWPFSRTWGYYPSSALGLVLIIILGLTLAGRL